MTIRQPLIMGIVVLLFIGEVVGIIAVNTLEVFPIRAYRFYHLIQIALVIVLANKFRKELKRQTPASSLSPKIWNRLAKLILIGLCFSFVGDVINSGLIDLSMILDMPKLLSAPWFMIAHGCYIYVFGVLALDDSDKTYKNLILGSIALILPLAFVLRALVIDNQAGPLLVNVSYVYSTVVVSMFVVSQWIWNRWSLKGWSIGLGGASFLISDLMFGYFLTRDIPFWGMSGIWTTYLLAQLMIAGTANLGLVTEDS